MTRAYLDYNATTPLKPEAFAAMTAALSQAGNPSSVHAEGRRAKAVLEDAREAIGAAVGARGQDIVFTSGATEALHLAIEGARSAYERVLVSAIEHDAVDAHEPEAERIACLSSGTVDLEDLERKLASGGPALVVLMLANNETGVVQPVARAAAMARTHGSAVLVDAAQVLGRSIVDMQALDASYLVVSGHKSGGPLGIGALALAPGAAFTPPRKGGGQERGARPGTENVAAAAGFAAAVGRSDADPRLRDRFEAELAQAYPDVVIFGQSAQRLPNTSLFAIPALSAETALIALDLDGVSMSSGSACSSGKVRPSRVLAAMGAPSALSPCALRASFGWASREADVDRALASLAKATRRRDLKGAA